MARDYVERARRFVPPDLERYKHWMMGGPEKEPCSVRGYKASATDPKNHATFEEVCRELLKRPARYSGFGYVPSDDDPVTAMDTDKVYDPKEGVVSDELAREVLEKTRHSWIEFSRSGTGFHSFVRGKLAGPNIASPIEVYSRGHFVLMTFKVFENGVDDCALADGQAFIDELEQRYRGPIGKPPSPTSDPTAEIPHEPNPLTASMDRDELLDRMARARNGKKFARLYFYGWDEKNPDDVKKWKSHSEADWALINILVYWLGRDYDRVRSFFEGSALLRREPGEKPAGYLERSVANAVRGYEGKFYDPEAEVLEVRRVIKEGLWPQIFRPLFGKGKGAPSARDAYKALLISAGKRGVMTGGRPSVTRSVRDLADDSGLSKPALLRAKRRLQALGLVEVVPGKRRSDADLWILHALPCPSTTSRVVDAETHGEDPG